jgi:hypothetical protein
MNEFPPLQGEYVTALTRRATDDPRVLACWLEGSLGRGNADRYSDVDAHLLVAPEAFESFNADAREWLEGVRPLVLFRVLFDGRMWNAVTRDGLRVDVWPRPGASARVRTGKAVALLDRAHHLEWEDAPPAPRPREETAALLVSPSSPP